MSNSKAIGHAWFNGRSQIGIVLAVDTITGKHKSWIHTYVGLDEEDDIKHIMEYGSKFPVKEAQTLIASHGTITDREAWKVLSNNEVNSEGSQNNTGGSPA